MAIGGGAIERADARPRGGTNPRLAVRLGAALRCVPRSLAVLLAIASVEGVSWCIVLPPLQGPDEISHFAYVQTIAETGSIPWRGGSPEPAHPGPAYSEEVAVAGLCSGLTGLAQNLSARAPASVVDERICFTDLNRLPLAARSDGGFTSAEKNPPFYYLYETVPYLAFSHSTFFARSFAMRLANLPFLLALIVFTWLLAGELLLGLPRGPALRTVATAAVALNPQLTMIAATINPDLLLAALWTAGLWLAVSIVRHGLTRTRVGWLTAICAMAAFTQGRGLPLIPLAAFTLAVAVWRRRRPTGYAAVASIAASVLAVLSGAYLLLRYALRDDVTLSRTRGFISYLWQFYLPRLGFMKPTIHPGYGVRQVFIDRFLGTFAQLEVVFSPATLDFLSRAAEVTAVAAIVGLVVHRRRLARAPWVLAVLAVGALSCLLMLHAVAYSSLLTESGDPVITGRYLLPLLSLYGVGIALAVSWLPRALSSVMTGAVVAGLGVLQLGALAILLERFYA
jgi:4-amino-4-deoxy-L-arabinose transferase-like glycosyltransferase